jgi:glucosamine--fructose-6-phosphate aminotransferase (isomerizing)
MCGIVGYVGSQKAKSFLVDGLQKLEYRGYDSAGIALYPATEGSPFVVRRCLGIVAELRKAAEADGASETQGIAHTRWATHGVPSEVNAHPHLTGHIVLVHNGIIENHAELKVELRKQGYAFQSQTDTEVFARLIETRRAEIAAKEKGEFDALPTARKREIVIEALRAAMKEVEGHYAILFMVKALPGHLFGVQNGAPMVVGRTPHGSLIGSDLHALVAHTREVSFVPHRTILEATADGFRYLDPASGAPREVRLETIAWSAEQVEKEGFETFMLKEIFQQPLVAADTLSGRLPQKDGDPFAWDHPKAHEALWKNAKKIYLVACGTAYYAAMTSKYFFEKWARLPVEVDLASEFRYRAPILEPGTVLGVISQSGETADTLAALRLANEMGATTFSVCNVPGSTIMRESNFQYPTKAGPEIGVASTKAFTAQLLVLAALAEDIARLRGHRSELTAFSRLPHDMEKVLAKADEYRAMGASLADKRTILFVGRGPMYPIALEGALKLKEISYRHAEGYAAGELKHGPIALVDERLATVVLGPSDELLPKTLSNLEEIKSRRGYIIGVGEEGNEAFRSLCDAYIPMPKIEWGLAPLLYVLPLQLISYGLARHLGCDIDKPRNLAKSVTVE